MKRMYMSPDGKILKRVPKNFKGEVVVPEGVEIISKRAFAGDVDITAIILPSSLKEIGEGAFEGCTGIFQIEIPEGVFVIPKRAFAECDSLVTISLPSSLREVDMEAFVNCSSLLIIDIPDEVTSIGAKAFANCKSVEIVKMPSSLNKLGGKSFFSCKNLKTIDIPEGVESIPPSCFEFCKHLTAAIFHDGLKKIEEKAFHLCSVKFIDISTTVETIGEEAFRGNGSIGLQIGASVINIGRDAFWANKFLTIDVDKDNIFYTDAGCKVIMETDTGRVVLGTTYSSIPETATKIARGAFLGTPPVLIVPPSVKVIETGAFANCPDGSNILLQEGVTTLEWGAFQQRNGEKLTVYIPSSVSHIGGQFSTVEFRLDAGNQHYRYDVEGHNLISKDGVLVWGHLLNGVPTEGVNCIEVVNYGVLPYTELIVPQNITYISDDICRFLNPINSLERLILTKGTILGMFGIQKTNCEIMVIVPQKKSASGISKNTEYVIPLGSSKDEINEFLGNDSIIA